MTDDPAARASALHLAHRSLLGPADPRRARLRRALATELIGESARTGRPADLLTGLLWQTVDLFIDGDRHAERRLGELRNVLERQPHPPIGEAVHAIEVMLAIRAGDLDRAAAGATFVGQVAAIRWYQDRIADLVDDPAARDLDAALAVAAAAAGDRPAAERALAAAGRRYLADAPRSSSWLQAMHHTVEAAYLLDNRDTCARAADLLAPYADLPIVSGLAAVCLGSVRHVLGVAALCTGRLDDAVTHLRLAVRDNLALRHWPALIGSRVRLAQALTLRGRADDLALARHALTTARDEADRLGLPLPAYDELRPGGSTAATCRRDGRQWLLRYRGHSVRLPSSVGLSHLAVLLANPGREIPAVELAAGLNALRAADGAGYGRAVSTEQELARLAVGKAIRRTTRAIARLDAQLGAHLEHTVKTGTHCSYRPR